MFAAQVDGGGALASHVQPPPLQGGAFRRVFQRPAEGGHGALTSEHSGEVGDRGGRLIVFGLLQEVAVDLRDVEKAIEELRREAGDLRNQLAALSK